MSNQSSKVKLKPGDLVKFDRWHGIVTQVLSENRVKVFWDNINGHWHYTHEQAKKLEEIDEGR